MCLTIELFFLAVSSRFGASPEDNQLLGFVRVVAKIVPRCPRQKVHGQKVDDLRFTTKG